MKAKTSSLKKYRQQRRLGTDLPGLGKRGALDRRPFAPGQHGAKRKKPSEYSLRLAEKQKLRAHYVLTEARLQRFVRDARRAATNWISELSRRLELRLDNLCFRGQFATSMKAARQLVRHGHIAINGKKASIGSIVVKVGDEITLRDGSREHVSALQAKDKPRLDLPAYLERPNEFTIKVVAEPGTGDVPFAYNDRLIAEYYALRGRR